MKLKDGVSLRNVQWQMFVAAIKVDEVFRSHGWDTVITSGTDGKHGADSLHYDGQALDFRTWMIEPHMMWRVKRELEAELGPDYDVVFEATHLHIEFQPKGVHYEIATASSGAAAGAVPGGGVSADGVREAGDDEPADRVRAGDGHPDEAGSHADAPAEEDQQGGGGEGASGSRLDPA